MTGEPGRRLDDGTDRGQPVTFRFDGAEVTAYPGETIAAALIAAGIRTTRLSRNGMPRGYFCGMGVCSECLVTVDDTPNQRACVHVVEADMVVRTATSPEPR
ncbi:MAG: (2Fe-2S)-binding protein [Hyphomicrobiales bacterium]